MTDIDQDWIKDKHAITTHKTSLLYNVADISLQLHLQMKD